MRAMNNVCHIEFAVTDMDRAQSFYAAIFGWTFREFMGGQMRVFGTGDDHVGGLMLESDVKPGRTPSIWFQVADLNAMVAAALANGGTVLAERSEVPGVGWSAQVADPDGNPVGLVEYKGQ